MAAWLRECLLHTNQANKHSVFSRFHYISDVTYSLLVSGSNDRLGHALRTSCERYCQNEGIAAYWGLIIKQSCSDLNYMYLANQCRPNNVWAFVSVDIITKNAL